MGRRHKEHGRLSPGTMSPEHLVRVSGGSEAGGSRAGSRMSEGSAGAMVEAEASPGGTEGGGPSGGEEGDLTRAVWMYDSTIREDVRTDLNELVATAGQLARAAQNLIAFTREQVRYVRAGLVMYRDKVQEAQRKISATAARARDHLGAPRRNRTPPPRQGTEPFSKSPLEVGQSHEGGASAPRWPPPKPTHKQHRSAGM